MSKRKRENPSDSEVRSFSYVIKICKTGNGVANAFFIRSCDRSPLLSCVKVVLLYPRQRKMAHGMEENRESLLLS
jgi:hypothetical protein